MKINDCIIRDALDMLGVHYPTKGYTYLVQGVKMCLDEEDFRMNDLYDFLQKERGVTKGAASMALDYAMKVSQAYCSEDNWEYIFRTDNREKGRMKPSTFIFGVARYLENMFGGTE